MVTALSENTLLILFEQKINHDIFLQVSQTAFEVEDQLGDVIIDLTPAYNSIHILFNINKISSAKIIQRITDILAVESKVLIKSKNSKKVEIPIYYGSEVAFDLQEIATNTALSEKEIIDIHSNRIYDVYAIGFAPGFAYLGNVDERIATPRKTTPRKKIPKGSLGIADQQTAIYPSESPGGWQIIGRTPISLIDYEKENLCPIHTGDQVQFISISRDEFLDLGGCL
jgi:KipI family sensor histidine kinase inhibitor